MAALNLTRPAKPITKEVKDILQQFEWDDHYDSDRLKKGSNYVSN